MKIEIEWHDVNVALPNYGVDVLLSVGWPTENRYRVVIGERNQSSDSKDFGQDYWWIYGPQGGQRATDTYIGTPTHWAFCPQHALLAGAERTEDKE